MKALILAIGLFVALDAIAQTRMIIVGDVRDAATNEPLAYATVGMKEFGDQTVSNAEGKFELSVPAAPHRLRDTLVVTYVGYEKFEKPVSQLASIEHVLLKDVATMLDEVRIVHRQLDLRRLDQAFHSVRGNLYACEVEVSNADYNNFLAWLEDYNKKDERQTFDFKLDGYQKSVQEFYKRYHKPSPEKKSKKDSIQRYDNYPAVNITHEGAVEFCKWLTDLYNENPKKKKFKKVLFRLPTLKEWQIAALGDPKFQSWNLAENTVEIVIPKDPTAPAKGERKRIPVDEAVMYPWFWFSRDKAYNIRGCYLGNFRIDHEVEFHCPANPRGFDGFMMMSHIASYFPNGMQLFDVVGNVAEMIDEKGKACGGSWNDPPENSTIHSVKNYNGPNETVGFRIFMEVIEK